MTTANCQRCKELEQRIAMLERDMRAMLKPHDYDLGARIRELGDYHAAINDLGGATTEAAQ